MEKKVCCVFCGKELTFMQEDFVYCGNVAQAACRKCRKYLSTLSEEECCRRALASGRANQPEVLEHTIAVAERAEEARPRCLRCGEGLRFGRTKMLQDYLHRASLTEIMPILPAYCNKCGKIELFDYEFIMENQEEVAYLVKKDVKNEG